MEPWAPQQRGVKVRKEQKVNYPEASMILVLVNQMEELDEANRQLRAIVIAMAKGAGVRAPLVDQG